MSAMLLRSAFKTSRASAQMTSPALSGNLRPGGFACHQETPRLVCLGIVALRPAACLLLIPTLTAAKFLGMYREGTVGSRPRWGASCLRDQSAWLGAELDWPHVMLPS